MREASEIFEDWIGSQGLSRVPTARGDLQTTYDQFRAEIASLRKSLVTFADPPCPLYGDIVHDGSLNAFAGIQDGVPMVAVFAGTLIAPFCLTARIMKCPQVLRQIGNPDEVPVGWFDRPLHADLEIVGQMDFSAWEDDALRLQMPKNLDRFRLAGLAAHIARDFIIQHEVAHLIFGHCGYLAESFGLRYMPERIEAASVEGGIPVNTRHALELIADQSAAISVFERALGGAYNSLYGIDSWASARRFEFIVSAMTLGVLSLFHLWEFSSPHHRLPTRTHPDPFVRSAIVITGLSWVVNTKHAHRDTDGTRIFREARSGFIRGVVSSGSTFPGDPDLSQFLDLMTSRNCRPEFDEAQNELLRIFEGLQRNAYVKSLPKLRHKDQHIY